MQVSVAGLRRNIKNIAHNYTEPQKKVREATSNDPWGPSSTLMSEIADLTYNIEAFSQIMEMLWKRLNDHGKNWRHVYKSLVLLEYLIKTGSERVGSQCKENIYAIQTLKDFQYFEDNKDQGLNVREKAKQLVTLLSSEERLRNERARALKARERFAQTVSGFGSSDSNDTTPTSPVFSSHGFSSEMVNGFAGPNHNRRSVSVSEIENARPQTVGEEELQLQLALAMSKEEADQEEKRRRSDELRLQMALSQSEQEFKTKDGTPIKKDGSALVDLLDLELGGAAGGAPPMHHLHGIVEGVMGGDPWAPLARTDGGAAGPTDPWSGSSSTVTSPQDPWGGGAVGGAVGGAPAVVADPWAPAAGASPSPQTVVDPWAPNNIHGGGARAASANGLEGDDEFSVLSKRTSDSGALNLDPLGPALLTPMNNNSGSRSNNASPTIFGLGGRKKDPLEFLGENSNLVNLDNLVPANSSSSSLATSSLTGNPFAPPGAAAAVPTQSLLTTGAGGSQTVNPFQIQNQVAKPSINEIREKQQQNQLTGLGLGLSPISPVPMQQNPARSSPAVNNPWSPVKTENPFLN
ncbi:unnamed protein product [Orchesella dallaii]|uniref:ENTH domain-containing protein n=1 Tax=Orchesella dallaii TaxID=48710 RepID=A0ABP1Q7Q0_9HEXA